ncbi:MAG: 4-(cytidine 5'-diphospho)-2-C-methyl-D-erythritol kinase [Coriobacteriia bacterium]
MSIMRAITLFAPAKINLYLGVGALREDGYHDVTTVLQTLEFGDIVRILPADELVVTTSVDLGIPVHENLAYRAALAFAEEFSVAPRAIIEIEKRVPAGAGLAGGSSDASAVIVGLARLHGVDPKGADCIRVARSLGADCVFFLIGGAALMTGRGDELAASLPSAVAHVLLVKPAEPVSTAAAYRRFDASPLSAPGPHHVVEALETGDIAQLAASLSNNLTASSANLVPEVIDALAWVGARPGVRGAVMAGSGSAVFALCENPESAASAAEAARGQGWWAAATVTRRTGVEITDEDEGDE